MPCVAIFYIFSIVVLCSVLRPFLLLYYALYGGLFYCCTVLCVEASSFVVLCHLWSPFVSFLLSYCASCEAHLCSLSVLCLELSNSLLSYCALCSPSLLLYCAMCGGLLYCYTVPCVEAFSTVVLCHVWRPSLLLYCAMCGVLLYCCTVPCVETSCVFSSVA